MRVVRASTDVLSSLEEIESLLLSRLPDEARESFLSPPPPEQLTQKEHGLATEALKRAAETIRRVGKEKKKILIFGDYDCDGVTSTAILWETLHELGIESKPFLPHREKHGYGISVAVLEEIWQDFQPDLLITVDNGIVAHEAFVWLREKGVETLLTDHHQTNGALPPADHILHSTLLSGTGIAWYLAHELSPDIAQKELDFAVLGTLADQVPLIKANRSIAVHGLNALRRTERPSLIALARKAKLNLLQADEQTVHYGFAPRINALGRISHALEALRALLSRQPERMQQLLTRMEEVNAERQRLTNEACRDLEQHIRTNSDDKVAIAVGEYAEGIVGLLASKLVDTQHKPAIVISTINGAPKASCRSVDGVNIIEILRSLPSDLFTSLGGHPGAAGFTLRPDALEAFISQAKEAFAQQVQLEKLEKSLNILGEIEWRLLSTSLTDTLDRFAPFGTANEPAFFSLGEVEVIDAQPVGKDGSHQKIVLRHPITKQTLSVICFAYEKRGIVCREIREPFIKVKRSTFRPGTVDIELVAAVSTTVAE